MFEIIVIFNFTGTLRVSVPCTHISTWLNKCIHTNWSLKCVRTVVSTFKICKINTFDNEMWIANASNQSCVCVVLMTSSHVLCLPLRLSRWQPCCCGGCCRHLSRRSIPAWPSRYRPLSRQNCSLESSLKLPPTSARRSPTSLPSSLAISSVGWHLICQ